MGVKIPLMKLGQLDEWRGISQGQVIGPDQVRSSSRNTAVARASIIFQR